MSNGFPSMTALLGLLAVAGYQNRDKLAELLGGLTKSPTGATPSTVGPGGLGGVLDQLKVPGRGKHRWIPERWIGGTDRPLQAEWPWRCGRFWVTTGPNKQLTPSQLEQAIGPDVLDTLTKQTGLSRGDLLQRLSVNLPEAVDKYTPQGRLPSASDFARR